MSPRVYRSARSASRKAAARRRLFRALWGGIAVCALAGALAAQTPGTAAPHRASREAVYHGYVQVFSHAAITVRSPTNRAVLRTFTYSPRLQRKLQNRHLVYGEKVAVYYQPQSQLAVKLKAKTYPGG